MSSQPARFSLALDFACAAMLILVSGGAEWAEAEAKATAKLAAKNGGK
jgi:hypothetical protein